MSTKCVVNKSTLTGIANAIRAKDGSTDTMLPSAMAAKIESIPTGGAEWEPHDDWPDIRAILAADTDTAGYTNRMIALMVGDVPNGVIPVNGAQFYKFSNGLTATSAGIYNVPPMANGYRWVIYASNDELEVTFGRNPSRVWDYARGSATQAKPLWIYGRDCVWKGSWYFLTGVVECIDVDGLYAGTESANITVEVLNLEYIPYLGNGSITATSIASKVIKLWPSNFIVAPSGNFGNFMDTAFSLRSMGNAIIDLSNCTGFQQGLQNCWNMTRLPEVLDLSRVTTVYYAMSNMAKLEYLPEVVDISSATNVNGFLNLLYSIKRVPRAIIVNPSLASSFLINFANSPVVAPDSLAKFDDDGNIVDGFAAFLPVPDRYGIWETNVPDYYKDEDGQYRTHASAGKTSDCTGHSGTRTMNFCAAFKAKFTAEQRSAIASAMTAHGWTLTW